MAYEPTEWKCGDVITAEALNHLEGGVAEALECCGSGGASDSGVFYVTITSEDGENYIADKTYEQTLVAYQQGQLVVFIDNVEYYGAGIAIYSDEEVFYAAWTVPQFSLDSDTVGIAGVTIAYSATDVNYQAS